MTSHCSLNSLPVQGEERKRRRLLWQQTWTLQMSQRMPIPPAAADLPKVTQGHEPLPISPSQENSTILRRLEARELRGERDSIWMMGRTWRILGRRRRHLGAQGWGEDQGKICCSLTPGQRGRREERGKSRQDIYTMMMSLLLRREIKYVIGEIMTSWRKQLVISPK